MGSRKRLTIGITTSGRPPNSWPKAVNQLHDPAHSFKLCAVLRYVREQALAPSVVRWFFFDVFEDVDPHGNGAFLQFQSQLPLERGKEGDIAAWGPLRGPSTHFVRVAGSAFCSLGFAAISAYPEPGRCSVRIDTLKRSIRS